MYSLQICTYEHALESLSVLPTLAKLSVHEGCRSDCNWCDDGSKRRVALHLTPHHLVHGRPWRSPWTAAGAYVALVTVCCHHRQHLQLRRSSLFVWPNSLVTARACYDRPRILHVNESIGQSCWIRSPRPMSHLQKSYQHALDINSQS